jgi:hypothetical protein
MFGSAKQLSAAHPLPEAVRKKSTCGGGSPSFQQGIGSMQMTSQNEVSSHR